MKITMLTWDTLRKFERECITEHYSKQQCKLIEDAAYVANMNRNSNPKWTESDIYNDFFRVLKLHGIAVIRR